MSEHGWDLMSSMNGAQRYRSSEMRHRYATLVSVVTEDDPRTYLHRIRTQMRRRGLCFFDVVHPIKHDPVVLWQAGETASPQRHTILTALGATSSGELWVAQSSIPGWGTSDEEQVELARHLGVLVADQLGTTEPDSVSHT